MLVLTRRLGETVFINEAIEVTVVSVKGNQVRLGIAVPESVNIVRSELLPPTPDTTPTGGFMC